MPCQGKATRQCHCQASTRCAEPLLTYRITALLLGSFISVRPNNIGQSGFRYVQFQPIAASAKFSKLNVRSDKAPADIPHNRRCLGGGRAATRKPPDHTTIACVCVRQEQGTHPRTPRMCESRNPGHSSGESMNLVKTASGRSLCMQSASRSAVAYPGSSARPAMK